ncbi:MAG: hypothetical protein RBS24_01135 [Bacilli bacterium]|nr:hypothetical protein [Bacilli bacterium]
MRIYDLLMTNRRLHIIAPSRENLFYLEYESKLSYTPDIIPFLNPKDEFNLIQANIIIESILNYERLSRYFEERKSKDVPFNVKPLFTFNDVAIYCPLFSVSNNLLIANGLGDKLTINHDAVDLFETYNFALYESSLTSLVKVGEDINTHAYYHYDFHTVYIINDQGRLDQRISLFDKHLKKPDYRNVIDRLQPVIKAYYENDQIGFINALVYERLISNKLFNKYLAFIKRKKKK